MALPYAPIGVSAEVLGGAGIAKLLNSQFGVKLLTEGLKVGADTPRGRQIQTQLGNIIGKQGEEPPEGGGGAPVPPPGPAGSGRAAAASMGKGPDQALAYAQEQIAAGNEVKAPDLQRRFRLGYGAAQNVLENARAGRRGPPPPPPAAPPAAGARF
jgi:hypothetical protein